MLKKIFFSAIFLCISFGVLLRESIVYQLKSIGFSEVRINKFYIYPFNGTLLYENVFLKMDEGEGFFCPAIEIRIKNIFKKNLISLEVFIKKINIKMIFNKKNITFLTNTIKYLFSSNFNIVESFNIEKGKMFKVDESNVSLLNSPTLNNKDDILKFALNYSFINEETNKKRANFNIFDSLLNFEIHNRINNFFPKINLSGRINFKSDNFDSLKKFISEIQLKVNNDEYELNIENNIKTDFSGLEGSVNKDNINILKINTISNQIDELNIYKSKNPIIFSLLNSFWKKNLKLRTENAECYKNYQTALLNKTIIKNYSENIFLKSKTLFFQNKNEPFLVLNQLNMADNINVFGFFNPINSNIKKFIPEIIIKNFGLNEPWTFSLIQPTAEDIIFHGKMLVETIKEKESITNKMKAFAFNLFYKHETRMIGCKNSMLKFLAGKIFLPGLFIQPEKPNFLNGKIVLKNFVFTTPMTVSKQSGEFYIKNINNMLDVSGQLLVKKGFMLLNNLTNQPLNKITTKTEGYYHPFSLNLNINLKTEAPINLNLLNQPFSVESDLSLHGKIENNSMENLQVSGKVRINGKNISLIGHKFENIETKLFFENSQISNPIIQANLSTKINRYNLKFNLFGVLDDLIISAKSNPTLTESQIFSLFFTGIKDQSEGLRHLFSALLTKNSNIFENPAYQKKSLLQRIISPTENIRFFPGVMNDSGTSLPTTASILVNLGENFSAVIEKDLKKYEDIRLSFEYMLTENFAVKMNRDFEGFLQALFELKFKF